jgi:hypothetical protein
LFPKLSFLKFLLRRHYKTLSTSSIVFTEFDRALLLKFLFYTIKFLL